MAINKTINAREFLQQYQAKCNFIMIHKWLEEYEYYEDIQPCEVEDNDTVEEVNIEIKNGVISLYMYI